MRLHLTRPGRRPRRHRSEHASDHAHARLSRPRVPAPPASRPASAAPPCVAGSNNDDAPGGKPGGATGTGQTVLDNIVPQVASGDVKIEATPNADDIKGIPGDAVTKSVTLDVNVGSPVNGQPGSNPYEGYTAEQAAQAMYWDNATPPQITEVGPIGKSILLTTKLIQYAAKAARGDQAALRIFLFLYPNASAEVQRAVEFDLTRKWGALADFAVGHPEIAKPFQELADGLWEVIMLMGEAPISGPATETPERLYVDASSASDTPGGISHDNVNKGACGEVAAAIASDPETSATVLSSGDRWVRVTLVGTQHGPLIHELKSLATPSFYCPPATVKAVAGQVNVLHVTSGCAGTITAVQLLTRAQTDTLSSSDRAQLLTQTDDPKTDLVATGIAYRNYDPSDATAADAVSLVANGNTAISGDSREGNIYYRPAAGTGGESDAIVAEAIGADGAEHPFLVRIAITSPATCSTADGLVGTDHMAYLQGGQLELQRNTSFTIDPKLLCTTDPSDTYSVTISGAIPGTKTTVNEDGTITYNWTNPDQIGVDGSLSVTAWDRDTGYPSSTVSLPVHVRDAAPICNDVNSTYDSSTLKGAPIPISLSCVMTGGLKVLTQPVPMIVLGANGGRTLATPGGVFATTPNGLSFTPAPGFSGEATAHVIASSSTPFTSNLDGLNSKPFDVAVSVSP